MLELLGLGLAAVGRGDVAGAGPVAMCRLEPHPATARTSKPLAVAISPRRNPGQLVQFTVKWQATGKQ